MFSKNEQGTTQVDLSFATATPPQGLALIAFGVFNAMVTINACGDVNVFNEIFELDRRTT